MHKETAAGAIVFRKEEGKTLYLLIYSRKHKFWGFPKGHIETGESETEAALREIGEETGLKGLRLLEGYRYEDIYPALSNRPPYKGHIIEKHSVYFLAETGDRNVAVDNDEVTGFAWMEFEEAMKQGTYESMRAALRKANDFLRTGKMKL